MVKRQQKNQAQLEPQPKELFRDYRAIASRLGSIAEVNTLFNDTGFAFSIMFTLAFKSDMPNYELSPGVFGATRSNWTYHTAMAMAQTCKLMNLTCKFEASGRRDAIIQTQDEKATVVIVAEWEWDYAGIFGKGKELDKLKASCKTHKLAEAFLLVYCPASMDLDYLQRIAEYWIPFSKSQKSPPTLFLHTIIFEELTGAREFEKLKTVEIRPDSIEVWSDQLFYLENNVT